MPIAEPPRRQRRADRSHGEQREQRADRDLRAALIRPKVTLDILIGRSAILHPGLFFSWSSVDIIDASGQDTPGENIAFGLDIAYAAMF
jgi:hypothetical protein